MVTVAHATSELSSHPFKQQLCIQAHASQQVGFALAIKRHEVQVSQIVLIRYVARALLTHSGLCWRHIAFMATTR